MKQQQVLTFQMLNSELEQIGQFTSQLSTQKQEVQNLLASLDEFQNIKPNTVTRFPIANGIFAQGTITDTQTLLINVGQGVLVPKTILETKELIAEQLQSLQHQEDLATRRQEEIYAELEQLEKTVSENMQQE